jgi:Mn-containing catalase
VVASGNLAADMYANVMAESTGRLLGTRLYEFTDDPGMEEMLEYLIARDTMHQNQWHATLESLGEHRPVPDSFDQEKENKEYNYTFTSTSREEQDDPPKAVDAGRIAGRKRRV